MESVRYCPFCQRRRERESSVILNAHCSLAPHLPHNHLLRQIYCQRGVRGYLGDRSLSAGLIDYNKQSSKVIGDFVAHNTGNKKHVLVSTSVDLIAFCLSNPGD